MAFFKEFKEFAIKGNMMDMAVGIIIGAAFNGLVKTLVDRIIMPPVSLLMGDTRFTNLVLVLREGELAPDGTVIKEAITLGYGEFIQALINFFILAMVIFMLVKFMNSLRRKQETAPVPPVAPPQDIQLLTKLNTLMEEQNQLLKKRQP